MVGYVEIDNVPNELNLESPIALHDRLDIPYAAVGAGSSAADPGFVSVSGAFSASFDASPAASGSLPSDEVQRVRLSRRSCIMRVESL